LNHVSEYVIRTQPNQFDSIISKINIGIIIIPYIVFDYEKLPEEKKTLIKFKTQGSTNLFLKNVFKNAIHKKDIEIFYKEV